MIASISEDGWVEDSRKILDYLFSYYILTDGGQSYVFSKNLTSLPVTYFNYINSPDEFAVSVKSELTRMLESYFETVEVICIAKQDTTDTSKYYVLLSAAVVDASGNRYDLSKAIEFKNSVANRVMSYSNYGDAYNDFQGL